MVYYFTSNTVTPSAFIYVGKDKVESMYSLRILQLVMGMRERFRWVFEADLMSVDEELIKYGLEEDIW